MGSRIIIIRKWDSHILIIMRFWREFIIIFNYTGVVSTLLSQNFYKIFYILIWKNITFRSFKIVHHGSLKSFRLKC